MALRAVIEARGTLRDVYGKEFPAIAAIRHSAVTNKLAPVIHHPLLGPILCAPGCAVNADEAIRTRRTVVANLASGTAGEEITALLGMSAAFRPANLPAERRTLHVLIVDEFQRFMTRSAGFDWIVAEARKFKLSLVVANQFVEQLATPVQTALFGNVGCLFAFRVGHRDARVLAAEFIGIAMQQRICLSLSAANAWCASAAIGLRSTLLRRQPNRRTTRLAESEQ
ncbi:MAG: type IV secretory system conjugative DNA transfer family protein [Planctomycetes bacterium]|nr:type IV secretory system conjugative DNA transfer family protein [Planctomycetota bacterium]